MKCESWMYPSRSKPEHFSLLYDVTYNIFSCSSICAIRSWMSWWFEGKRDKEKTKKVSNFSRRPDATRRDELTSTRRHPKIVFRFCVNRRGFPEAIFVTPRQVKTDEREKKRWKWTEIFLSSISLRWPSYEEKTIWSNSRPSRLISLSIKVNCDGARKEDGI